MKKNIYLLTAFGIALSFFLGACGGGGSSTPVSSNTAETGQVALMVKDGPSDDFDHIWVTITRVLLLPSDGGPNIVIHEDQTPEAIDLLDLRAENEDDAGYLLAIGDVPVGHYDKIRLEVAHVWGEKDLDVTEFKLSSGKIDLNPRGLFFVEPGITLSVTLDIDCDKSIHYANNDKKDPSFRPVVFVDIERTDAVWRCPRVVKGTIQNFTEEGFDLLTATGDHQIHVLYEDNVVIMDASGNAIGQDDLAIGDNVNVRGLLDAQGLHASLIVTGQIDHIKGVVTLAVTNGVFEIDRYPSRDGGTISVTLSSQPLILFGCDQQVDSTAIQPGMLAHIYGQIDSNGFTALAVLLQPHEIVGEITAVTEILDDTTQSVVGHNLTVTVNPDSATPIDETVFLPAGTPIKIQLDGELALTELTAMVNCSIFPTANIHIDPTIPEPLTVMTATILPEPWYVTVNADVDVINRIVPTDSGDIHIGENAYFFDFRTGITRYDGNRPGLMDIEPGDLLLLYGLPACEGQFSVTTVLILPSNTL